MMRLLTFGLLLFLCACTKKKMAVSPVPDDTGYFPVSQRSYRLYEADSVVYTEIPRDTLRYRYQIKEVFTEPFVDVEGNEAWKMERHVRKFDPATPYDSLPWTVQDVWQVNIDSLKAQVVEENIRYTKLVFPALEGKTWEGSPGNADGAGECRYLYTGRKEKIGSLEFEKVLLVGRKDFTTLISVEQIQEKYAMGAGLAWSSYKMIYSNDIVPNVPVEERIMYGVIYTRTLVAYGKE